MILAIRITYWALAFAYLSQLFVVFFGDGNKDKPLWIKALMSFECLWFIYVMLLSLGIL